MSQLSDTHSNVKISKLTTAQRNALSRAAQGADGALALPDNLKGKAVERLAASLIDKGLVREVRAKPGMPVWRRDDKEGSHALIITKLGRASINADEGSVPAAALGQTTSSAPNTRSDTTASAGVPSAKPRMRKPRSPDAAKTGDLREFSRRHGDPARPLPSEPDNLDIIAASTDRSSPEVPRPGSKLAAVIALLEGESGSSVEELCAATGWLPHTTRAALTGLRKRGYVVERLRSDKGGSTYRIVKLAPSSIAA